VRHKIPFVVEMQNDVTVEKSKNEVGKADV
jgi:hypothetical protein